MAINRCFELAGNRIPAKLSDHDLNIWPFRRSRDTLRLLMAERANNDTASSGTPNPEFAAFENLLGRLLAVPHSEIQKRVEQHRKQAAKNPRKPGPKGKRSNASPASGAGR
jgi:hypothetical protein